MAKITEYAKPRNEEGIAFTLCEFTLEEAKKIMETGEIMIEPYGSTISVRVHDPDEITCRVASPKESEESMKELQETGKVTWKPHKPFNF